MPIDQRGKFKGKGKSLVLIYGRFSFFRSRFLLRDIMIFIRHKFKAKTSIVMK